MVRSRASGEGEVRAVGAAPDPDVGDAGVVRPEPVLVRPGLKAARDLMWAAKNRFGPGGGAGRRRRHPRRQEAVRSVFLRQGVAAQNLQVQGANFFPAQEKLLPKPDDEFTVGTPEAITVDAVAANARTDAIRKDGF